MEDTPAKERSSDTARASFAERRPSRLDRWAWMGIAIVAGTAVATAWGLWRLLAR